MDPLNVLFEKLWKDYSTMNQQAEVIHRALEARGEEIVNDHVAFRTFDHPKVNIAVMASHFVKWGYKMYPTEYVFKAKKLYARHFQHPDPLMPRVFISEIKTGEFSPYLQKVLGELIAQVSEGLTHSEDFLISGTPWKPVTFETYQKLLSESEYAAWMAAFGFRVNHFTIFYNRLKGFRNFQELNAFVKNLGYPLNQAGGETKGSSELLLEQSSTLAHPVEVAFADGKHVIPACYYEFAHRYPGPDGKLFSAFLPDSADKIFESTNFR